MKKKKKKISLINVSIIGLVFILSVLVGDLVSRVATRNKVEVPNNTLIRVEKQIEVPAKTDSLPLENGGKVVIEIIDGRKLVYVSYEDLEYISKKRSRMKKLVKNIAGLFARLVE